MNSSRRQFLRQAPCAALGSVTALNLLANLRFARSAAADGLPAGSPPKSLVVLFLHGGQDSFNQLVPTGSRYSHYAAARTSLAIPEEELLPLDQLADGDGQSYGLHPNIPGIAELFNGTGAFAGKRRLAFVTNAGALVEPTTLSEYQNRSTALPQGLFSHIDQIKHWQTSVPQGQKDITGWAGRAIECIRQSTGDSIVPASLSVAGTNILQTGPNKGPFAFRPNGASILPQGLDGSSPDQYQNLRANAFRDLVSQSHAHVLEEGLANRTKDALESQNAFQEAYEQHPLPPEAAAFFENQPPLATELGATLRGIIARETLGHPRQTFYLQAGGWDHHVELLNTHSRMLGDVSQSLHAYQQAIEELGLADSVLTLVVSEFGRTLRSNGRGSDHAWGGNLMALGGSVRAGRIHGQYPSMEQMGDQFGPLDLGLGGRFLPTLSTDEVVAEALRWFGLSDTSLLDVLPNLSRFWTPQATGPVGYLT
ncbi:MAG: DUF1501 domain-containing protein [Roseibacillus sp.]